MNRKIYIIGYIAAIVTLVATIFLFAPAGIAILDQSYGYKPESDQAELPSIQRMVNPTTEVAAQTPVTKIATLPSIADAPKEEPKKEATQPVFDASAYDKVIVITLSSQNLSAYENGKQVRSFAISSGTSAHPTPRGTFNIYSKTRSTRMSGPGYSLPGVPYVSWFYGDYSIHGTYWHSNFGRPMSHGCINAPTSEAAWIYSWAPIGTTVVVK